MKTPKTFESGLTRLQEILDQLADESTPLARSIKLYAEAADLVAFCNDTLQDAQVQIQEIDTRLAAIYDQEESV